MRNILLPVALLAGLVGSAALAQAPEAPKAGSFLYSKDGKRIGRIERIVADRSGQPQTAAVIYDSRFVYVPLETLTLDEANHTVSSLSRKEIGALR